MTQSSVGGFGSLNITYERIGTKKMILAELRLLIAGGESGSRGRVAFKRSTGKRTDAAKTVCAMLNAQQAGHELSEGVLFGVSDQGVLVGQHVSARTLEEVVQELRRSEPPAFPDLETVALENGNTGNCHARTRRWRSIYLIPMMARLTCDMVPPPASCRAVATSGYYWIGCTHLTVGRTAPRGGSE